MKTNILFSITLLAAIGIFAFTSKSEGIVIKAEAAATKIEVIQFHSEHRCTTCLTIEELTRETLKSYPSITFSLVNVDDKKNEAKAEQFEAAGTSLFLYNAKTGKKQDLTDFAFMNANDEAKFKSGLKKHIDAFLKS